MSYCQQCADLLRQRDEAVAECAKLKAEIAAHELKLAESVGDALEYEELRAMLSGLLTAVALAIKGPPPPHTLWSWHDLPELAAAAQARIGELQAIPCITESPDGNPGWETIGDAVQLVSQLRAQIRELRELIEKAPHGLDCQHNYRSGSISKEGKVTFHPSGKCTCWKARAGE